MGLLQVDFGLPILGVHVSSVVHIGKKQCISIMRAMESGQMVYAGPNKTKNYAFPSKNIPLSILTATSFVPGVSVPLRTIPKAPSPST